MDVRCYVVYGSAFKPLKIKGMTNKNKLMEKLKKKGFHPKYSRLNPMSKSGKKCTTYKYRLSDIYMFDQLRSTLLILIANNINRTLFDLCWSDL